jgi:DNA-binding LytR/AlgR family response regulator
MKVRCLIVEDEPPARELLKTYVGDCSVLELVKVCADAFAASEVLQKELVDLLLLDINLPRMSGFSFLKTLSHPPLVIFTTAYPEYAVEGFEADAVDYLLKPFSFDRFLKAVNKAVEKIRTRSAEQPASVVPRDFILLRADRKTYKVNFSGIRYVEATGDYLKVHLDGRTLVVHGTVRDFLEQLPAGEFIRVHKSFVVPVSRILFIEGNRIRTGDTFIPIGRAFKEAVERRLGSP